MTDHLYLRKADKEQLVVTEVETWQGGLGLVAPFPFRIGLEHRDKLVWSCIDVSTTRLSDHLTISENLHYVTTNNVILATRKTYFMCVAAYAHMQSLSLGAFPHLSEHRTPFQAFCRYVNWLTDGFFIPTFSGLLQRPTYLEALS